MHSSVLMRLFFFLIASLSLQGSHAQTIDLPSLTPAFSGSVGLVKPLPPIQIPGGLRLIEPLTPGSFSGPLLNATIQGGIAYPTVVEQGTLQQPVIIIYGTTCDNSSVFVQASGVGPTTGQFVRLTIEVGGRAKGLMDEYILATITPSKDRKSVAVKAYTVG